MKHACRNNKAMSNYLPAHLILSIGITCLYAMTAYG